MIDIHCHILPEVDDGPKSWEVAEAMCRRAAADGIEHMVATPHSNDRYFYDREYLSKLLHELQRRIGDKPVLSIGCDFHLSYENMQSALQTPERYRIANSRYLLVEFSNFSIPPQVDEWFTNMNHAGTTPIITHPERNPIVSAQVDRRLAVTMIQSQRTPSNDHFVHVFVRNVGLAIVNRYSLWLTVVNP